jgi:hypothetical protein
MVKKRAKNQRINLTPNHLKSRIALSYTRARVVPYIFGKLSMRATTCFSNLTSIGGLHKKLWVSKMVRVLISKITRLLTWESHEKHHLDVAPIVSHKEYHKGEGGSFPQI